jgi:hypothetical protein
MNLNEKIAANQWDHVDDVIRILQLARSGKWSWCENTNFKYINVRIDTRDGGCILMDRNGKRADISDFEKQPYGHGGTGWPVRRTPSTKEQHD